MGKVGTECKENTVLRSTDCSCLCSALHRRWLMVFVGRPQTTMAAAVLPPRKQHDLNLVLIS